MKITKFNQRTWQSQPNYRTNVLKQMNKNLDKYYNNDSKNKGTYDHYRVVLLDKHDKRYNNSKLSPSDSRNCFKVEHSYYNNYGYRHTTTLRNVPTRFILNMSKFTLAKRDRKFQRVLTNKFGYHHLKSGKQTKNPTFSLAKDAHAGLAADDATKLVHNDPYCSCNKNGKKIPFHMEYSNIGEETGCPINHLQHAISNGERITQNFLKQNGISYMYGHRMGVHGYDVHGGPTNGKLHADFFIPHQAIGTKNNIVIEIDGSQHNFPTYLGGMKGALHQEHNGRIKDLYCKRHHIKMVRVPESAIYNNYYAKHLKNNLNKRFSVNLAQKDEITQILDKEVLSKINPKRVERASYKRTINKHHLQKKFGKKLDSKSYFLARPKQVKTGVHFFKANQQFGKDLTAVSKNRPHSILNYNEHLRTDEKHMNLKQLYSKHFNEVKSLMRSDSYDISPERKPVVINNALRNKMFKPPYSKRSLKIMTKLFKTFKNSKEQNISSKINNRYDKSLDTNKQHDLKSRSNNHLFSKKQINQQFRGTQKNAGTKNKKIVHSNQHQTLFNRTVHEERKLDGLSR